MPRADKGARHAERRDRAFESRSDEDKFCPDALRYVLTAIRKTQRDGASMNAEEFRALLNETWPKGRLGKEQITSSVYKASEVGSAPFHYYYLEAYARALSVPAGVILLISRILSEFEDGGAQPALDVIGCVERSLAVLREMAVGGSLNSRAAVRRVIDHYGPP